MPEQLSQNTGVSLDAFILEDFKLKLENLSNQYTRLWQRLGFFLTLEAAIFGFYGSLAFRTEPCKVLWPPCVLGIAVSLLWYIVAAQDRWLVVCYRDRANKSAKQIGERIGIPGYENEHPGAKPATGYDKWCCWYYQHLSITTLPAWTSTVLVGVWIAILVFEPFL